MKVTVKDPYEQTIADKKIRAIWDLVRPFTLVAPLIGGGLAALMGLAATDRWSELNLFKLVFGCVTLAILNGASNAFNQWSDVEIDEINKPYRPIPRGILGRPEVFWISVVLYVIALRAFWINWTFFGIVAVLIFLTIIYSAGPRLKDKLFLNNFAIAFARGGLGLAAGWSIFTDVRDWRLVAMCIVLTVFLMGATTLKDLSDVKGDRKFGCMTLPVALGTQVAIGLMIPFSLLASIMCFYFEVIGVLHWLAGILATYYFVTTLIVVDLSIRLGCKDSKNTENSWQWLYMYGSIAVTYVMFFIMIILS